MSNDLRLQLHNVVDQLPGDRLADVLCFVEMLVSSEDQADVELEEAWFLASGAFRLAVREDGELPEVVES